METHNVFFLVTHIQRPSLTITTVPPPYKTHSKHHGASFPINGGSGGGILRWFTGCGCPRPSPRPVDPLSSDNPFRPIKPPTNSPRWRYSPVTAAAPPSFSSPAASSRFLPLSVDVSLSQSLSVSRCSLRVSLAIWCGGPSLIRVRFYFVSPGLDKILTKKKKHAALGPNRKQTRAFMH